MNNPLIRSKKLVADLSTSARLAQKAIGMSVWWDSCKHGPVLAKRFSSRVQGCSGDWYVSFGANDFLVGSALKRIYMAIPNIINTGTEGKIVLRLSDLRWVVASSVANNETGAKYRSYRLDEEDGWLLRFGTMSLDTKAFILSACEDMGFKLIRIL
jgi:hypothetical protein